MAFTVQIKTSDPDNVSQLPAALKAGLDPANLRAPVGDAVALLFKKHFLANGTNKQSFPSTGFWASAARATNWTANKDGVSINVNWLGVRQRFLGGEIHPTPGHKYLTIPARAEAYGKRAGEFNNLVVAFGRGGQPVALVESESVDVSFGRRRKNGTRHISIGQHRGGGVMFWLVKSVTQKPDPSVIPSDAEIMETAAETINSFAARFLARRLN